MLWINKPFEFNILFFPLQFPLESFFYDLFLHRFR
jgi:hypothetical protein